MEKTTEKVAVQLTREEVENRANRLSKALRRRAQVESEATLTSKRFKGQIAEITNEIDELANAIETKTEWREVEVPVLPFPDLPSQDDMTETEQLAEEITEAMVSDAPDVDGPDHLPEGEYNDLENNPDYLGASDEVPDGDPFDEMDDDAVPIAKLEKWVEDGEVVEPDGTEEPFPFEEPTVKKSRKSKGVPDGEVS